VNQRLTGGLTLQASYTYSRLMTDADSFSGSGRSLDAARPELEWSVGRFDVPHNIKINTVYELPFGEGKRWLQTGVGSQVIGGWRVAVIQSYNSGFPIAVTTGTSPLNIFNGVNRPNVTGQDWRAPIAGAEFDPAIDRFLNRAAFVQPVGELGNAQRTNPDARGFWNLSENVSLAKSTKLSKQVSLDIRLEAFNIFNRVIFAAPGTTTSTGATAAGTDFSNSNTFGVITAQANNPRRMQLGAKLYF